MDPMSSGPAHTYHTRLKDRQATEMGLARSDQLLSYGRLITFVAGGLLAVLWWRGSVPAWSLAFPALSFAVLMYRHDQL